jgi:hypothetical protein
VTFATTYLNKLLVTELAFVNERLQAVKDSKRKSEPRSTKSLTQ